jgi:FkbM family methyltransferase
MNYSNSNQFFVNVSNYFFKKNNIQHKIELTQLDSPLPPFKVTDLLNGSEKFFGYRKQGLMAFGNGIAQRGNTIGKDYLLDNINFEHHDVIIDIGANTGDLKIYFDNKGIDINYMGFEPGLIEFECLKRNNPTGQSYQIGLGNEDTSAFFYYKPEFGDSSLVEMAGYTKKYEVQVNRFSSIMDKLQMGNKKIKLVKLEAEGFEPEIISGMGDYLNNIEYITADLGFERGVAQETTAPSVLNNLLLQNFEILNINGPRFVFLLRNKRFN